MKSSKLSQVAVFGFFLFLPSYSFAADPNMAAAMGDIEQIKSLVLASPSAMEQRSGTGMTPLMSASAAGELEIVKYLLSQSAKLSAQDDNGWTPLHYAVAEGKEKVAALLLEKGADRSIKTKDGLTPLDLSERISLPFVKTNIQNLLNGQAN